MCNLILPGPEFLPVWYMRKSSGISTSVALFSITVCMFVVVSQNTSHSLYIYL
jgi:hypothetical protein